jgi:hypothetical protein
MADNIEGIISSVEQHNLDGKVKTKIKIIPEKKINIDLIFYQGGIALRAGDYISASGRIDNEGYPYIFHAKSIFRLKSKRNNKILESYEIINSS